MPSKHTLNVSLTDELLELVRRQVATGRFRTASEVVRAALRLFEREVVSAARTSRKSMTRSTKAGRGKSTKWNVEART